MTHKERLETIDMETYNNGSRWLDNMTAENLDYLITRVRVLTEALEKILEEADGPYSCITARKALGKEN